MPTMAEETTAASSSALLEGNAPIPEAAVAINANNSSVSASAEGANRAETNDDPDEAGGAASAADDRRSPPPAAGAAPPDAAPDAAPLPDAMPAPPADDDHSAYFAALRNALRRRGGDGGGNAAIGGNNARSSSSAVAVLLWDGAGSIAAAGDGGGGEGLAGTEEGVPSGGGDGAFDGRGRAAMNPERAALYLYAVAQNIVALEAAVLGSRPPPVSFAAAGGMMDGMGPSNVGGGVTAKQVAEIISAVSIAATFCNPRSLISQSGILPALAHLIESTGTIAPPPSANPRSHNGNRRASSSSGVLHALTPFHPEFLQCCLLAGQYRYARSFLSSRPASRASLEFSYLRLEPAQCLRAHYYAGLVHAGCDDWNAALDSFHLCLAVPCSSVSAIAVAARKKGLLLRCLLLESEELDGGAGAGAPGPGSGAGERGGGGGGGSSRSALENEVLDLPGAASAAVSKYMTIPSNRGGGGAAGSGSAPERTAGSETSEQPPGRERHPSRRRARSANPGASADGGGGERGAAPEGPPGTGSRSRLGSYHDLVSAYVSGDARRAAGLLSEAAGLLRDDGNWGLAKRLRGRLAYRAVRRVASVYSVAGADVLEGKLRDEASLGSGGGGDAVGEAAGRRGVEDLLMGMAECDARDPLLADPFVARMDHSTGTVSFLDRDDDESSEVDSHERWMEDDLSRRLGSCIALAERVRDLDIRLTTSPKYQQHAMKQMMMKGDSRASAMMQQQGGSSVADIGHGPMDIGVDW